MRKLIGLTSLSALALMAYSATTTPGANAKEMFEGETIRVLIGYGAGGGYDRYGRLSTPEQKHTIGRSKSTPLCMM